MKDDNIKYDFEKLLKLSPWDALNLIQIELEETLLPDEEPDQPSQESENDKINLNLLSKIRQRSLLTPK